MFFFFFLRNLGNMTHDVFAWGSTVLPHVGAYGGIEMVFSFLEGKHTVVDIVTRSTYLEVHGPFIVSLSLQSFYLEQNQRH